MYSGSVTYSMVQVFVRHRSFPQAGVARPSVRVVVSSHPIFIHGAVAILEAQRSASACYLNQEWPSSRQNSTQSKHIARPHLGSADTLVILVIVSKRPWFSCAFQRLAATLIEFRWQSFDTPQPPLLVDLPDPHASRLSASVEPWHWTCRFSARAKVQVQAKQL